MGHIELLSAVTSWICALRLSFRSRLRSCCLTMHISARLLMIRNHGSPRWKSGIYFTINSSHSQELRVPAYDIPVCPTFPSANISASGCSYSLCIVWKYQWTEGYSNISSRWISRYILPIPCDKSTPEATALINCPLVGRLVPPV